MNETTVVQNIKLVAESLAVRFTDLTKKCSCCICFHVDTTLPRISFGIFYV